MKRFTRDLMVNGITEDDWVGLDRFTAERTAYKKRAVRLVLLAQHQQRTHAISDNPQEFIRAVSRRCSHWTRKMSLAIGYHLHGEIYTNVPNEERTAMATELRIEDEKIAPPAPATSRTSPLDMVAQNKTSDNGNRNLNKRLRSAIELEVDSFAERMKGRCVHPKR